MICKNCGSFNVTTYTLINSNNNTTTVKTCHNCNNTETKSTNPSINTSLLKIF